MKSAPIETKILMNANHEPFFLYSMNGAAEALGVSRKTLEAWVTDSEIATITVGKREKRIAHFELLRFVADKYKIVDVKLQQFLSRVA